MERQKTIKKEISFNGTGLHTGKNVTLTLKPAKDDSGIVFNQNGISVPARIRNARCGLHYSFLRKGKLCIHTVEHLLSALYGAVVTNCVVDMQVGDEIPFFDGSSLDFARALRKTGFRAQKKSQKVLRLKKPVILQNGKKLFAAFPSSTLKIFYLLEHTHAKIGAQSFFVPSFTPNYYLEHLAPARTFATMDEAKQLVQLGLAKGGSMSSAVLVGEKYSSPLRFPNEFARHKVLDIVGDIALLGMSLAAHIVALRTGHYENHLFVKKLTEMGKRLN